MIKDSIERLNELFISYKATVDTLAESYFKEKNAHLKDIAEKRASGHYAEKYFEDDKKNYRPSKFDYAGNLIKTRKACLENYEGIVSAVRNELADYINSPISPDYVSKLQAIINSGLSLSDYEMQVLEKQANTYFEKRLFSQLASQRKNSSGEPNPYLYKDFPDMDKISRAFDDLVASGRSLFNAYCGTVTTPKQHRLDFQNEQIAVLHEVIQPRREKTNDIIPAYLCASADNVIKNNTCDEFIKLLDSIGDIS